MRSIYLTIFILSLNIHVLAAPHPGTGTSALTSPTKGLFLLERGFQVVIEGTKWIPTSLNEETIEQSVQFSPIGENSMAVFTIRTDKVSKDLSLDLYTRKWMRDYPNYGFEVLSAKNFNLNGSPALVVDLLSRSKKKQVRQVIVRNDERLGIMTCLDSQESFNKTLNECNHIMKSFAWIALPANSPKK